MQMRKRKYSNSILARSVSHGVNTFYRERKKSNKYNRSNDQLSDAQFFGWILFTVGLFGFATSLHFILFTLETFGYYNFLLQLIIILVGTVGFTILYLYIINSILRSFSERKQ